MQLFHCMHGIWLIHGWAKGVCLICIDKSQGLETSVCFIHVALLRSKILLDIAIAACMVREISKH